MGDIEPFRCFILTGQRAKDRFSVELFRIHDLGGMKSALHSFIFLWFPMVEMVFDMTLGIITFPEPMKEKITFLNR